LLISKAKNISEVKVVSETFKDIEKDILRELCDKVLKKIPSSVMLFGSIIDGKPLIICCLAKDLVSKGLDASKIVKTAAKVIEGGGGGRNTMAEAGGKDPSKLDEAIKNGVEYIRSVLEAKS